MYFVFVVLYSLSFKDGIAPTSIFEIITSILRNVTVVVQIAKKDNG